MAAAVFEGVKITGLACAVPKNIDYIRNYADKFNVEKFISSVGVEQRRVANEWQCGSDFCYEAAERLIDYKGYDRDSFDGIILVTQSPDYDAPATSHILHLRLGLSKNCMAFDINLACSGFVYGVYIAASMIKAKALERVLLCCGEAQVHSYLTPQDDPSLSMMLGDAGCAVIIEKGDDTIKGTLNADGSGYRALITPGFRNRVKTDFDHLQYERVCNKMDGPTIFEFAIKTEPMYINGFLDTFHETMDDFDYCVLHQANRFILEHIRRKLRLPKEKMPISIERYGNTSGVSIPLAIADLCPQLKKNVNRFIVSGFGAGLSWGVMSFSMEKEDILPVIETEEYYKEAYRR